MSEVCDENGEKNLIIFEKGLFAYIKGHLF